MHHMTFLKPDHRDVQLSSYLPPSPELREFLAPTPYFKKGPKSNSWSSHCPTRIAAIKSTVPKTHFYLKFLNPGGPFYY